MSPQSVLITGANRGIGLGLVKAFLADKEIKHVIAGTRTLSSEALTAIEDPRLHVIELDVDCDNSIREAVLKVDVIVGKHGLNLLINNAGIATEYSTDQKPKREIMASVMMTNAVSVTILTQYFLPLLKLAASNAHHDSWGISRAAIINISSYFASVSANDTGSNPTGLLAYRTSKTALNSITKTMSIDLQRYGILSVALSPGWVKTDMGGSDADLTVKESMEQLVPTIYKLDKKHNGGCFTRTGETIPC